MMDYPLHLTMVLDRAEKYFSQQEIVSRNVDGTMHRYSYADFGQRVRTLSGALRALGVKEGDRVATFAWNNHRHLEAYFAVPCMGAVLHTVNIRLHADDLVYLINHARDKVLLVDEDLVQIIDGIRDQLTTVEHIIVMTHTESHLATNLSSVYAYEDLIEHATPLTYQPFDEQKPLGVCYTSGTTGRPKGVVYTHRSTVLHTLAQGLVDGSGLSAKETVMPIVPMFHVNAWGYPYAAVMFGCKLVLPGNGMAPNLIADLMENEKVTFAAGVPTIWIGLARELAQRPRKLQIKELISGGAAIPDSVIQTFEESHGIRIVQGYGMTETSPIVALSRLRPEDETRSPEAQYQMRSRQGYPLPGVEVRVVGHHGDVPWDDTAMGEIWMRGPWIASEYDHADHADDAATPDETFAEGWLHTGDVATVDARGSLRIVDRTKDLVKSGGEWISSVALENALMGHEAVAEAAVVAIAHPVWGERPLAVVVLKGGRPTFEETHAVKQTLVHLLAQKFVKWWIPDAFVFVEEIPKSSVGKFLKRTLREQYADYYATR